jgi:peptidyl-prolyl cis-trans isomerase B (cyclophilin B)
MKPTTGSRMMPTRSPWRVPPEPHSATAQFFINLVNNDFLNYRAPNAQGWGYCVFGKVVEGRDVVDRIKAVKTGFSGGHSDVPVEDVLIERAEVCCHDFSAS